MTTLSQFTSADAVRAAIGVADEEITNADLELPLYDQVLQLDLYDLEPTISAYYVNVLPVPPLPRTSTEQRFADLMELYCCYVVAQHLLITMPMFAPKTIKDSKTEMERIQDPYAQTRAGVSSFYTSLRIKLLLAYGVLVPTITLPTVTGFSAMFAVPLGVDPVTGA